ncbi:hypothetical protein WUBG_01148 [Wuchereria bancrofti]|uniref:Uncharacterized protein n=1 Tax=Wuchereria bancrofti TaxID=6293 RepID=J9BKE8_WUCBA|nr:hypothetical protein WUBG_01148 [Wuchereria bancrofti]
MKNTTATARTETQFLWRKKETERFRLTVPNKIQNSFITVETKKNLPKSHNCIRKCQRLEQLSFKEENSTTTVTTNQQVVAELASTTKWSISYRAGSSYCDERETGHFCHAVLFSGMRLITFSTLFICFMESYIVR